MLGVTRSSTAAEIKSAFRKLAAKHHPDRNPDDPGASQRFKELNAAYQILSDPKKRAMFDRFGAAGVGGAAPGNPFQGMPIDFSELNIDGLFGDLLDALGIRVGERGHVQAEVALKFEEAAFGCTKPVSYTKIGSCMICNGSGAARGSKRSACAECNGRGRVRFQQGVLPIAVERTCSQCSGTGTRITKPCDECHGAGMRSSRESLEVRFPAGIDNGAVVRMESAGNTTRGGRRGDLEVTVRVKPHEFFRRNGDNISCSLPITFAQAVLGDEVEMPTMEGKGMLRIPAGTQPGTILRVRGKGIPRKRMAGRGDQLVEVQVEVPTELNERQKELVMELAEVLGESVQPQRRTFMDKLKDLFSG